MKYFFALFIFTLFVTNGFFSSSTPVQAALETCRLIDSGSPAQSPWGQPYRVAFNSTSVFANVQCDTDGDGAVRVELGRDDVEDHYMYGQFYIYNGQQWLPFSIPGFANDWAPGKQIVDIPVTQLSNGTNYIAAYACEYDRSANTPEWKCGCHDASCASPNWSLQAFPFEQGPEDLALECVNAIDFLEELVRLRYTVNPNYSGFSNANLDLQGGADPRHRNILLLGLDAYPDPEGPNGIAIAKKDWKDKAIIEAQIEKLKENDLNTCVISNALISSCAAQSLGVEAKYKRDEEDRKLDALGTKFLSFSNNACT